MQTHRSTLRRLGTPLAIAVLVLVATTPVRAGHIPYPPLCDLPSHFVSCPGGDLFNEFVLRKLDNTPDMFVNVRVSACNCPNVHFATPPPQAQYTLDSACAVVQLTAEDGSASLHPLAGGTCAGIPILMFGAGDATGGVYIGTRYSWASPDQDGDLIVTSNDLALIQGKVGTTDLTADLDGDGRVTAADVAIAQQHLGHSSLVPLGIGPSPTMGTSLSPIWPNPCRVRGTIPFRLATPSRVTLKLYDLSGRVVAALLDDVPFDAGPHQAVVDTRPMPSGVYLVRLRTGEFGATRLLVVAR